MNALHIPIPVPTPLFPALLCVLSCAFSILGLLTIWIVRTRQKVMLRAGGVLAILWLAARLWAHDVLLIFLLQVVFTSVMLGLASCFWRKGWRAAGGGTPDRGSGSQSGLQFSLRTLLLSAVPVACATAILVDFPNLAWTYWREFAVLGFGLSISTIGTVWILSSRQRLRVLFLEMICAAGIITALFFHGSLVWDNPVILCVAVWASMVGWLMIARTFRCSGKGDGDELPWWRLSNTRAANRRRLQFLARGSLLLMSIMLLIPPSLVCLLPLFYKSTTHSESDFNGYDEVLLAAEGVFSHGLPGSLEWTPTEARDFLGANDAHLHAARSALARECWISPRYLFGLAGGLEIFDRVEPIGALTIAFSLQGELAEAEGRTDEAVRCYTDLLDLGGATRDGGVTIHRSLGKGSEGFAVEGFHRLVPRLQLDQCQELIQLLQLHVAGMEPHADVVARETVLWYYPFYWRGRLVQAASAISGQRTKDPVALQNDIFHQTKFQLLICELASQCYYLEQGKYPDTLEDLIPDYLSAVARDPFSGAPFVRDRTESAYALYSVGPDGRDDGGRSISVLVPWPNGEGFDSRTTSDDITLRRSYPEMIVASVTPKKVAE